MRVFACVCVHSLWCDTRRLAREGPSHVRAPVWLGLEKFLTFEFLRFLAAQLFSPKTRMSEQSQHVINEAIPGLVFTRALRSLTESSSNVSSSLRAH